MVMGSLEINTDVLIIGGGPGGYVAAIRAAQLGKDVTLVEMNKHLGGVCLNTGCIPTKAMIHASNFFNTLKELKIMGIEVKEYSVDIKKMQAWKESIVDKLRNGLNTLFKKHGIEVVEGKAVFETAEKVRVEGKTDIKSINFKYCIIATGSSPIEIPGFTFDRKLIVTSDEALTLEKIPEKLVIIGGGYIGTEMGTVYGKLGSEVHIVEAMDRLIPTLEKDIVQVVANKLSEFNVKTHFNSKALSCEKNNGKALVKIDEQGKETSLEADMVLVVVGRKPNSKGIGLEEINLEMDKKGFIVVDEQMRTNIPHIYAIGDVVGQPMLAHKATREGKVAAEVIAGEPSAFDNKVIPFVVFNDPEICSVGLTEEEAKEKGYDIIVGSFPFSALGRAITLNQTEGFVKFVAEKGSQLILGLHAVGPGASDFVSEATLAIEMSATLEDIASTIHPHPSLPESLMEAAEITLGKGIHIFKPKN